MVFSYIPGRSGISITSIDASGIRRWGRLFVSQLGKTGKNELVIKAIVQLARGLGADVVAEGIETDDQLLRLRSCGVALGQGYFLSKPLSVLEATRWIEHSIMARREERSA